jgi:hypothetical protein
MNNQIFIDKRVKTAHHLNIPDGERKVAGVGYVAQC